MSELFDIHSKNYDELNERFKTVCRKNIDLESQIKLLKKREGEILNYCEDYVGNMWAARIVSIILECDFRDAKIEVRKALEKLKELK